MSSKHSKLETLRKMSVCCIRHVVSVLFSSLDTLPGLYVVRWGGKGVPLHIELKRSAGSSTIRPLIVGMHWVTHT